MRLASALRFAALGIRVFPCWPVAPGGRCACPKGASCRDAGKHPIWECAPHGLKSATTDAELIRVWWSGFPDANPAGVMGFEARIFCLDVDPRNGGDESSEHLQMQFGRFPDGPRSTTGGGGEHLFFAYPLGGQKELVGTRLAELGYIGLDVKSDDGYVMLPGSGHKSGRTYVEQVGSEFGEVGLPDAPAWLLTLLTEDRPSVCAEAVAVCNLPVGRRTQEFLAGGVEIGGQRLRALAAARNLQGSGLPFDKASELIWSGLCACPQNGDDPWTRRESDRLTRSIFESAPRPGAVAHGGGPASSSRSRNSGSQKKTVLRSRP